MYSPTVSFTSALDGGMLSMSCPGCFTIWKDQVPIVLLSNLPENLTDATVCCTYM